MRLIALKCRNYDSEDVSCTQCALHNLEDHNSCYRRNNTMNEEIKKNVSHPAHYSQDGRRECIEEMRLMFGDEAVKQWCVMTAYKYSYRAGNKDGNSAEQDCAKREWYLNYAENM